MNPSEMNEDQIRELFKELRDEPLPADSLARVRMGVAQRSAERSRMAWWKPAVAIGAVACVVLAIWWPRAEAPAPAPQPVARQAPAPEPPAVVEEAPAPVVQPPRPRRRPRAAEPKLVSAANPSVVIRIETPDPEVVILLVN